MRVTAGNSWETIHLQRYPLQLTPSESDETASERVETHGKGDMCQDLCHVSAVSEIANSSASRCAVAKVGDSPSLLCVGVRNA